MNFEVLWLFMKVFSQQLLNSQGFFLYRIHVAGNFQRKKTFANFTVLWLFTKVFSAKFGGVAPLALQKRAIRKSYFSPIRESFLSQKFPAIRYVMQCTMIRYLTFTVHMQSGSYTEGMTHPEGLNDC